jgi:hypothetical protein
MTETIEQFLSRGGVVTQCNPQAIPKLLMTVEGTGTRAKPSSGAPRQLRRGSIANSQLTYK